jgi:hypothetical protein
MNAISWPIAVLILALLAAFGGLNRPLKAISEGLAGFFRDFREFKETLERTQGMVENLSKELPKTTESFEEQIKRMDSASDKIQDSIKSKFENLGQRLIVEGIVQEAAADNVELESTSSIGKLLKTAEDAQKEIEKIANSWENLKGVISKELPETGQFDGREYGKAVLRLASDPNSKLNPEVAEKIASLHSRFKSFTRRKAYATEWLTQEMSNAYVSDASDVDSAIKNLKTGSPNSSS